MPTTMQHFQCQTCQRHYDTSAIIPTNKVKTVKQNGKDNRKRKY